MAFVSGNGGMNSGWRLFRRFFLLATLSLAAVPWTMVPLHAVAPRVNSLLPIGAQRGTEVEVRFAGQRLNDVQEVVFYAPGISW
jgi:hypothetical protein